MIEYGVVVGVTGEGDIGLREKRRSRRRVLMGEEEQQEGGSFLNATRFIITGTREA